MKKNFFVKGLVLFTTIIFFVTGINLCSFAAPPTQQNPTSVIIKNEDLFKDLTNLKDIPVIKKGVKDLIILTAQNELYYRKNDLAAYEGYLAARTVWAWIVIVMGALSVIAGASLTGDSSTMGIRVILIGGVALPEGLLGYILMPKGWDYARRDYLKGEITRLDNYINTYSAEQVGLQDNNDIGVKVVIPVYKF